MSLNRREFLRATSLAGGSMVALGTGAPVFLQRAAAAAPQSGKPGSKDTILVVVQLSGGNDGLNTVVPFKDPTYVKSRPSLRLRANQVLKVNDELGLHPQLTGFSELLEDGQLSIVQGVGYPNPNQSHFRSMDIWQAASMAENLTEGWIGRALKQLPGAPTFHLKDSNESAPLALDGSPVRVPSIASLEEFQLQLASASNKDKRKQREVIERAAQTQASGKPDLLSFVQKTAANTYASSRRLQEIGKNYQPKVPYPATPLANKLQLAAQLIDANLGSRIFYVSIGGFDTHANQALSHANLMTQLSGAMTAFYKDMAARGHGDRIAMMTFSEFGRRVKENGSRGTDHGTSAPMFLVGTKVKAGPVGEHPSLTDLKFGNMKHHIDFRQVYAAVLEKWLGVESTEVLGKKFAPVGVFA